MLQTKRQIITAYGVCGRYDSLPNDVTHSLICTKFSRHVHIHSHHHSHLYSYLHSHLTLTFILTFTLTFTLTLKHLVMFENVFSSCIHSPPSPLNYIHSMPTPLPEKNKKESQTPYIQPSPALQ